MSKGYMAKQFIKQSSGSETLSFARPCVKIIIQGEPGSPFALNSELHNDACYLGRTGYFELDFTENSTAFLSCVTFFDDTPEGIIVDYFERI